jgi:hypothetical protein
MNQPVADEPVILMLAADRRRPQDQAFEQARIVQRNERDNAGDGNDGDAEGEIHGSSRPVAVS